MNQLGNLTFVILGFENGDSIGLPANRISGLQLAPIVSSYNKHSLTTISKSKMCLYFNIKIDCSVNASMRAKNGLMCPTNVAQRLSRCDLATVTMVIVKQDGAKSTEQVPVAMEQTIEYADNYAILRNTNKYEAQTLDNQKGDAV